MSFKSVAIGPQEQYRLGVPPFTTPVTIETIFQYPSLEMLHKTVLHGLASSNLKVIVVTGEKGYGKTTFCHLLQLQSPHRMRFFPVDVDGHYDFLKLIKTLLPDASGATDSQTLSSELSILVFYYLKRNIQPVFVIDNAHCLSYATLVTLLKLQKALETTGLGTFKCLLIGDRQISSAIEQRPKKLLTDAMLSFHHYHAVNPPAIKDYIRFKLKTLNKETDLLSKSLIHKIETQSQGVPARIDQLLVETLNTQVTVVPDRLQWADEQTRHRYPTLGLAVISILIIVGLVVWMLPTASDKVSTEPRPVNTESIPEAATAVEPAMQPAVIQPSTASVVAAPDSDANQQQQYRWLEQLPTSDYLLQILGAEDFISLNTYRQELILLNLPKTLAIAQTNKQGKPWFVLLYGPYPSYADADRARATLPAALRDNKPWIRMVDGLQQRLIKPR